MIIITNKKIYHWNYKRCFNNLKNVLITVLIIVIILYISNQEYLGIIQDLQY